MHSPQRLQKQQSILKDSMPLRLHPFLERQFLNLATSSLDFNTIIAVWGYLGLYSLQPDMKLCSHELCWVMKDLSSLSTTVCRRRGKS